MAIWKRCSSVLREIKQDKRRQSLIENAEKARLSKKLVTLDSHVKLDVPIGELAVHEPDNKRLIAFLKAMEFNSLMRRVAEFSRSMLARSNRKRGWPDIALRPPKFQTLRLPRDGGGRPKGGARRAATRRRSFRSAGRHSRPTCRAKAAVRRRARTPLTPQMLAAARIEAARNAKFDRAKYETVRRSGAPQFLDRACAGCRFCRARRVGRK